MNEILDRIIISVFDFLHVWNVLMAITQNAEKYGILSNVLLLLAYNSWNMGRETLCDSFLDIIR